MAISNDEQQQLIALTVGLFDAAPGAQYLDELTEVYEANNNSLESLADYIINTPAFNAQYAGAESQDDIIGNAISLFGVEEGTDAFAEANAFFQNGLEQGRSETSLLIEAANYLNGDDVAPEFADIATKFQNKVEVASYLSVDVDADETDIAALKDALANVTEDPQSVEDAKAQIDEDYGNVDLPPVSFALQDLQDANEAKTTFLTEDAIASDLVLEEFADSDYDSAEEALAAIEEDEDLSILGGDDESIEDAVGDALTTAESGSQTDLGEGNDAVGNAATALGDYLDDNDFSFENETPNPDSFANSSRTIQDTVIDEAQAALGEATEETEAAVGEFTGLSGRIATLEERKAEFEATLKADVEAEEDVDTQLQSFMAVNAPSDIYLDDAGFSGETSVQDFSAIEGLYSATGSSSDDQILELVDDTWEIVDDSFDGVEDLQTAVQAAYDADQAKDTAQERFDTAIERVVEAEDDDYNADAFDATDYYSGDNGASDSANIDVSGCLDLDSGGASGGEAPLSQALIDLREAQTALDDTLAELDEARELSDTLEGRDDDIAAAEDVFSEDFDLNLLKLDEGNDEATAENDIFLFAEKTDNAGDPLEIALFGEQGQDHLFFGNTDFELVELDADASIEDRAGDAEQLEVFWQQDGADLQLFVEGEAAAGTDQNAENITQVTLTEFSAEDIASFEDGLLSTAPVEVA